MSAKTQGAKENEQSDLADAKDARRSSEEIKQHIDCLETLRLQKKQLIWVCQHNLVAIQTIEEGAHRRLDLEGKTSAAELAQMGKEIMHRKADNLSSITYAVEEIRLLDVELKALEKELHDSD